MVLGKRDEDRILWGVVLDLLYEMSRIQRLRREDLEAIDDEFIGYLFQLVEEDPDDSNDPYHYPIIRMLVCDFFPIRRQEKGDIMLIAYFSLF